jgi:elongation factor Ts
VEVNCETDFVARTDEFKKLVHEVALQIAAMNPAFVSEDQMPADYQRGPEEAVLLKQPSIRDASKTMADMVKETIAKTGENIVIRRFCRFELGGE